MTKQHVFPDRLKHVLPKLEDPKRMTGSRTRTVQSGKMLRREDFEKQTQGSPAQFKIRKVCQACNLGWLKAMEEDSVPVLERLYKGEISVLSKADQGRLAKLATSIAMVGEWISDDTIATTQAEREAFRERVYAPPGWFVFIGKDGAPSDSTKFMTDGCMNLGDKGRDTPKKEFLAFTFTVGPVLFHVLTLPTSTILDVDSYAAKLGLASICPPTDWINFTLMPALDANPIGRIRTYAAVTLRKGWKNW